MTNEEKANQIAWEYSKHYDPNCCKQVWVEMGAREMAEWKEQQMIEKACEWLEKNAKNYHEYKPGRGIWSSWRVQQNTLSKMVEDFKKAMKGE